MGFVNSIGNGQFQIVPNVGLANVAPGGPILSGALTGDTFNPDGLARDFRYDVQAVAEPHVARARHLDPDHTRPSDPGLQTFEDFADLLGGQGGLAQLEVAVFIPRPADHDYRIAAFHSGCGRQGIEQWCEVAGR